VVLIGGSQLILLDLFTGAHFVPLKKFEHPISTVDFTDRRLAVIAGAQLHVVDFYSDTGNYALDIVLYKIVLVVSAGFFLFARNRLSISRNLLSSFY
jgi:hypothetical protein